MAKIKSNWKNVRSPTFSSKMRKFLLDQPENPNGTRPSVIYALVSPLTISKVIFFPSSVISQRMKRSTCI